MLNLQKPSPPFSQSPTTKRVSLITSTITIAEAWKATEELNNKAISPEVEKKLHRLWHPAASPIELVDVHELIARECGIALLRTGIEKGWSKTCGNDAIHLVTAKRYKADEFLTNDAGMKKWESILGFKVCAPHYDLPEQAELYAPPEPKP